MAEDKVTEAEDGEDEAVEVPEKKSKKKLIIMVAAVLLLVAASIGGTLFALKFFEDPSEQMVDGEMVDGEVVEGEEEPEEPEELQPAIYYPLKPVFIANYNVRGRQRFLQIEMTLMLRDNEVVTAIDLHVPAIRNGIIMLLRGQDYGELQTPEGKELLRQQALLSVQAVMEKEIGKPGVEQVLFTNVVMQ